MINVNNLVFDKVLRVAAFNKSTDDYLYGMTQVQDAALNGAAESTDVMDNVGAKIMTLYRAKTAEFSGSNALFDLGVLAAQVGTEKKVGAALVPAFETIEVGTEATVTLAHTPKGQITEIFALNGDSTLVPVMRVPSPLLVLPLFTLQILIVLPFLLAQLLVLSYL